MYSGAYLSYAAFIDLGNNAEYTRGDLMKLFIATLALAIAANAAETTTTTTTAPAAAPTTMEMKKEEGHDMKKMAKKAKKNKKGEKAATGTEMAPATTEVKTETK